MPTLHALLHQLQGLRAQPNRMTLPLLVAVLMALPLTLLVHARVFAAENVPQAIYLPLVSTPNEQTGPISDQPSEWLIAQRVNAGTLDEETALLQCIARAGTRRC